jgi:hypothetical protein
MMWALSGALNIYKDTLVIAYMQVHVKSQSNMNI